MSKLEFSRKKFSDLTPEEVDFWKIMTGGNTLFCSPFFQYDYAKLVSESGQMIEVVLGVFEGKVVFILPLQYGSKFDLIIDMAHRLGGHMSDYSGAIIDKGFEKAISTFDLPVSYAFFDHVPEQCHQLGENYLFQEDSSLILLNGDAEQYFAEFKNKSKKYYNDVKRLERLVCKDFGEVSFTFSSPSESEYTQLVEKKVAQYIEGGVKNPLDEKWTKDFLLSLFNDKDGGVKPYLSTLYAGDTWLASHFGIESNGVFHYWFPVHNTEANKYSPGKQLLFKVIEHAYEAGFRYIDLGLGETNLKGKFSNGSIPLFKVELINNSLKSSFARALQSLKWRLR